jgi:hypothetical protein
MRFNNNTFKVFGFGVTGVDMPNAYVGFIITFNRRLR